MGENADDCCTGAASVSKAKHFAWRWIRGMERGEGMLPTTAAAVLYYAAILGWKVWEF